jgi:hypothetical protein
VKRALSVLAAAGAIALVAGALQPTVSSASKPANATISYSHPKQVFVQSHPMQGGSPAGFVQTICNTQQDACDPVTFSVDPTRHGKIDHSAVLKVVFKPASPSQMGLAEYPPGCPEDSSPVGTCATYFQTSSPYLFPDPGKVTLRLKVVCQACVDGSYQLIASLKHVKTKAVLPPAGDTSPGFTTLTLPDPKPSGGAAGQLTSQFGEPGIYVNKHGYGIVNTFGPTVWITKNAGRSFSKATDVLAKDTYCQSGYAGDADAVVGADNTFYADNLCLGTLGIVNNESFTNKTGKSGGWSAPALAGGESDRQWYVLDPKHPKTLYVSFHSFGGPDINVFKSTDGGKTFSCPETGVPVTAATSTVDCPVTATSKSTIPVNTTYLDTGLGNVTTRPMIDPHHPDWIYVPYADTRAAHAASALPTRTDSDLTRFRMAVSRDGGKTWAANTDPTGQGSIVDTESGKYFPVTNTSATDGTNDSTLAHIFIGASIDKAGNLYILFSLRMGKQTPTHLYLMTSTTHGRTWSRPHRVDSNGLGSNVFPAIVAGSRGRVAMTWYGSKAKDFNDTTAQWSEMYAESVNALAKHPVFTQSRMSSANTPVHAADICQAGTLCAVTGGNRNLADYQSVTVSPCGFAVAVYTDDHAPQAHTVVARQTAGNSLYVPSQRAAGCAGAIAAPAKSSTHPVSTPPVKEPSTGAEGSHLPMATTGLRSPLTWTALALVLLALATTRLRRRAPARTTG